MTVTLTSRETARDKIATLLTTALTGTGNPVQAVYNYRPADFQGQSPVVVVTSDGSRRGKLAQPTRAKTVFKYLVIVFVVYATTDGSWTEANAEDALDTIEKKISEVILENDTLNGFWAQLERMDSKTDDVEIGGVLYRREIIEVEAQLYEN